MKYAAMEDTITLGFVFTTPTVDGTVLSKEALYDITIIVSDNTDNYCQYTEVRAKITVRLIKTKPDMDKT